MYGIEARLAIQAKMVMITDIRKTAAWLRSMETWSPFETVQNSKHHTL
jgi:hypothetical protein